MTPILIQGMQGLGDNIYQRAVLRELARPFDVYLETPWPQLYEGTAIRCVRPVTKLRTQAKNIARVKDRWHVPPPRIACKRVHYVSSTGSLVQGLCDAAGVQARTLIFDAPIFAGPTQARPYILIRPATIRTEWHADSRNPRPEYLAMAADKLRQHFHIISVADLSPGAEWPVLPLPYADETYHAGELELEQLMALVAGAAGIVGGVGWVVPASIAYRVPLFLIFGGWGKHNGPARIFDSRLDTSRIHQSVPDRFCLCGNNSHACDKGIAGIGEQLDNWIVRLVAERQAAMAAGNRHRLLPGDGPAIRPELLGAIPAV